MRLAALYLVTLALATVAWKDWFRSACGLLVMTALIKHPDYPAEMLGVPGLHPWNFLFAITVLAWLVSQGRKRSRPDLSPHLTVLLLLYLGVVLVGFLRAVSVPGPVTWSVGTMFTELLVNPLKFAVLGMLMFDGARTPRRMAEGLLSVVFVYLILGLLVIRWVPPHVALRAEDLQMFTLKRLGSEIGFYRTDLATMLAGGSWAAFAVATIFERRRWRWGMGAAGGTILLALLLTAGRGGYLAAACVGLVLSALRWRRYLVLGPLLIVLIVVLFPGVGERSLEGFQRDESLGGGIDAEALSAGRFDFWPYVWEKISEAPWVGYGRLGMQRSGLGARLEAEAGMFVPHPHNAYLEWLLDNGWVGMALVAPFYLAVLYHSLVLFRDSRHSFFVAAGGAAFALVFSQLVAGVSGRHWYPAEETAGMWCAIGLMMRVWVERSRQLRS
jgi:O-antigen ligase